MDTSNCHPHHSLLSVKSTHPTPHLHHDRSHASSHISGSTAVAELIGGLRVKEWGRSKPEICERRGMQIAYDVIRTYV
eukprot:scaffold46325_cov64-Cyclotella_meneghiniana.AAC.1